MAENLAFAAVMRSNEHTAPALRAARRVNSLRPSQGPELGGTATLAGPSVRQALSQPGEPLGDGIRSWMENRFESHFSDVRIYRGTEAAASAGTLHADAYTVGNRIVFASGQYDPGSAGGRRVLAHELAHVIQQRSGPVGGLPIGGGVTVSQPGDRFEEAAENEARQIMTLPGTASAARAARPGDGEVARTGEDGQYPAGVSTPALPGPALPVLGTQRTADAGSIAARHAIADPSRMRPSQVPYSQHAFGNAAVQRPLAGRASSFADKAANNSPAREPAPTVQRKPNGITVQRRAWNNEPAKFRTENELGAPNSEYDVTATGYRRFAPVNIWRDAYDQVYYDRHDRSFMYLRREDVQDETFEFLDAKARVDTVASGRVTLRRAEDRMLSSADRMLSSALRTLTNPDTIEKLVGDIAPSEGKVPLDFTIRETGAMDAGWHIGHSVTELRRPLPILDNPEILAEVLEELERLRRGDPIVNRDTMKAAIIARYAGHGLRIIHPRQVPGGPPSRQVYGGPDVQGPAAAAGLSAHAGCGP